MEYNDPYYCIAHIGNHASDGVFIYSLQNGFLYCNPPFKTIFKIASGNKPDITGILQTILSEDKNYLVSRYDELLEKGCIIAAEFRLNDESGNTQHLCCDVYRQADHNTLVGFVKDITKTKEHENYLVEYTAKKDTFLDMITHNLSGPLNLSQNILGWVEKSLLSKKDINALILLLQESTQECIQIVNDFLKEEHRESQTIYVHKTRFNVIDRLRAIMEKLTDLNPDKHILLVSHLQEANINSDSVKFFQIIHILMSNAIKFTPTGGEITLTVDEEGDGYIFTVKDNGIGIPEALQQHIFDNRSRARREGLNGEKSNGIGLYLIKKLVELIDGTIWFKSEENKGTSFFVRLPKE